MAGMKSSSSDGRRAGRERGTFEVVTSYLASRSSGSAILISLICPRFFRGSPIWRRLHEHLQPKIAHRSLCFVSRPPWALHTKDRDKDKDTLASQQRRNRGEQEPPARNRNRATQPNGLEATRQLLAACCHCPPAARVSTVCKAVTRAIEARIHRPGASFTQEARQPSFCPRPVSGRRAASDALTASEWECVRQLRAMCGDSALIWLDASQESALQRCMLSICVDLCSSLLAFHSDSPSPSAAIVEPVLKGSH
ncbi:hypothetical protein CCMA1212_005286 [Trichoderma ghanense]|uniref:Uncharacterized protein n=1 Tax=Trichoderma ghanense TaxID=65468 RepID=A0ABY2H327_9HYPO